MGINFFGIEEDIQYLGIKPTKAQLAAFAEIPFSEAVLQECKDTHILIAVFPIEVFPVLIMDIRKRVGRKFFNSHEDVWYNTEFSAKKRIIKSKWYLILKEPVPSSTGKTWNEQQELLGDNEEIPEVRIMIYTIIGHYLATGKWLFESIYVRCADFVSDDSHVFVGRFLQGGRDIGYYWNSRRSDDLGLASSRLPVEA